MADELSAYFLGAWAENNDLFERALLELTRDHVYWRRNFHPDDTPPIGTQAQFEPEHQARVAVMMRELHRLAAQLRRSVPTFHPRYLGHMMSDLLLPGLLAQLTTTLYNPNNIVEEAAPVTLALEHEAGQGLCRMVGYRCEPSEVPCALGHLTSGGTLANDEALWLARAVKLFPLAVKDVCLVRDAWPELDLRHVSDWELLGWSVPKCLALVALVRRSPELAALVEEARAEAVGLARFAQTHPLVADLVVLAPASAHYSWKKAARLLGVGARQLQLVPTHHGRVDVAALAAALAQAEARRAPVLAVVGVYGSTELGALDELHELAALRDGGRGFWLHVDAAWGGYVPSLFRDEAGALRPRAEVRAEFAHFPSERVYRSTAALAEADSVTVDPHKLGYVAYGAGAVLVKDRRALDLARQWAPYLSDVVDEATYRNAAAFSLEGSRPGAAAAAVALNHRVLPLSAKHFGRLVARSIEACEAFYDAVPRVAASLKGVARLATPFEPDCNVVALAVNLEGNTSLAAANAYARRVYEGMSVRPSESAGGQGAEFFASCTTLSLSALTAAERQRLTHQLGLDLAAPDAAGLFLLRHTLMNPWLLHAPDATAPSYLEAYFTFLLARLRACAAPSAGERGR